MRCCFVNKRKVMGRKQRLLIILPEVMSDIQVQIVKGGLSKKLILDFRESEGPGRDIAVMETEPFHRTDRKFVLVWYGNDYRNVPIDDILWVKASGSYSVLHLAGESDMVVSSNLSTVGRDLPESDFARIHRSCIVNLCHVRKLVGSSLNVGGTLLPIGREYRESVFNRFIFLGTRRNKK